MQIEVPSKQASNSVTPGAPTRSNEKGMCPTCNRLFGIKAYDRHVAWCKERATRPPANPATNLAKERLEARIRYRAPALKNRRPTIREKYMPGSSTNLGYAVKSTPLRSVSKPKESVSLPNCNKINDSPTKHKPAAWVNLWHSASFSWLFFLKIASFGLTNSATFLQWK